MTTIVQQKMEKGTSQLPMTEGFRTCLDYVREAQPRDLHTATNIFVGATQLDFVANAANPEIQTLCLESGGEREIYCLAEPDQHLVSIAMARGQLLTLCTRTTAAAGTLLGRSDYRTEFIAARLNNLPAEILLIEDDDLAESKIQEEVEYLVRESARSMYDLLSARILADPTSSDRISQSMIRALGFVRDSASERLRFDFLRTALKHSQIGIRLAAVDALGVIGGSEARAELISHQSQESVPTIRKLIDSILRN